MLCENSDNKMMYFQLAAKVADAIDIQAQQEGETEFMDEEPFSGLKVMTIQNENSDF